MAAYAVHREGEGKGVEVKENGIWNGYVYKGRLKYFMKKLYFIDFID